MKSRVTTTGIHLKEKEHNLRAPYWAAALFLFVIAGVTTLWFDWGYFWKSYLLDMVGPAWSYILFRGLFTSYRDNAWSRFFSPGRTFGILLAVSFLIEFAQYLELYPSTFDSWDFLAYTSLLLPVFLLDSRFTRKVS